MAMPNGNWATSSTSRSRVTATRWSARSSNATAVRGCATCGSRARPPETSIRRFRSAVRPKDATPISACASRCASTTTSSASTSTIRRAVFPRPIRRLFTWPSRSPWTAAGWHSTCRVAWSMPARTRFPEPRHRGIRFRTSSRYATTGHKSS